MKNIFLILALLISVIGISQSIKASNDEKISYEKLDEDYKLEFVNVNKLLPQAVFEMVFAGSDNFLNRPAKGYNKPICYLTRKAAYALKRIQDELILDNKTLKIYDCYRPLKAVKDFKTWTKSEETKEDRVVISKYFPELAKDQLFKLGHLSERPGNSRGSTIDLTIIDKNIKNYPVEYTDCRYPRRLSKELNMGTHALCYNSLSHTDSKRVEKSSQKNRKFLKDIMKKYGFKNYYREWWHYTLVNEPHPFRFFDFDID